MIFFGGRKCGTSIIIRIFIRAVIFKIILFELSAMVKSEILSHCFSTNFEPLIYLCTSKTLFKKIYFSMKIGCYKCQILMFRIKELTEKLTM
jgi:hypothetical protein